MKCIHERCSDNDFTIVFKYSDVGSRSSDADYGLKIYIQHFIEVSKSDNTSTFIL